MKECGDGLPGGMAGGKGGMQGMRASMAGERAAMECARAWPAEGVADASMTPGFILQITSWLISTAQGLMVEV